LYVSLYVSWVKRIIDFVGALCLLLLIWPVLLVVVALLFIEQGKLPVFVQERVGYRNQIFRIYKLKTMTDERDEQGELLPDHVRLTKLGKLVRSTSLDELPQLFNILRGEMSFIGPRPLLVEYLAVYSEQEKHRHDVLPGITGLAQVNGRNTLTWKQKFQLDLEYIRTVSFFTDVKIALKTTVKVLDRKTVNQAENVTLLIAVFACRQPDPESGSSLIPNLNSSLNNNYAIFSLSIKALSLK